MNNGLYNSQGYNTTEVAVCKILFATTTGQAYPTNTNNKAQIGTTVYDSLNIIRATNSIVVKSSGYYNIYTQVYTDSGGSNHMCSIAIYINGNAMVATPEARPTAQTKTTNISTVLQLNAEDVIEFYTFSAGAAYDITQTDPAFNTQASYAYIYKIK
jgi:hypothetical protein